MVLSAYALILLSSIVLLYFASIYNRFIWLRNEIKEISGRIENEKPDKRMRQVYEKQVQEFNSMIERFPTRLVASLFGLKKIK